MDVLSSERLERRVETRKTSRFSFTARAEHQLVGADRLVPLGSGSTSQSQPAQPQAANEPPVFLCFPMHLVAAEWT